MGFEKINKNFTQLKNLSEKFSTDMHYKEDEKAYHIFLYDDSGTEYSTNIYKNSFLENNRVVGVNINQNAIQETDFLDNFKEILDARISLKPKTDDSREYLYTTSRPVGTSTYFTSEGDDNSNYRYIGGGSELHFNHEAGSPITPLYFDCNVLDNSTYVHEGYISYVNCDFDKLSFHFVPRTTSYISAPNTTFNLLNGYLVIPAAGDGTIQLTEVPNLVAVGKNSNGVKNIGFWDAEFNYDTGVFENLRPNLTGEGNWNIFGEEILLYRMIQRIILVGTGEKYLETAEHGAWEHGARLKISYEVNNPDHDMKVAGILVLYREKVGQVTR